MKFLSVHWHHIAGSIAAVLAFVYRADLLLIRIYNIIKPSPSTFPQTSEKGSNQMNLAQLETLAATDLAELSTFAALGAKLAPTLEAIFPGEASVIALVVNGLAGAPKLIVDAETLIADVTALTSAAQPATPVAPATTTTTTTAA